MNKVMRQRSAALPIFGLVVIAFLIVYLIMTWSVSGQTDVGEPTNFFVLPANFLVPPLYFRLTWDAPVSTSTTITGYEIERSVDDWNTDRRYPWKRLANVSGTTYSYNDHDIVTCNGWYYYRLRAKSGSLTSAPAQGAYWIEFPPGCPEDSVPTPVPVTPTPTPTTTADPDSTPTNTP